jgi:Uncharacterized conserved protein
MNGETMIVTNTDTIEGHPATAHFGLVTGEAIVGVNIFRDLFAGIRDILGGRAGGYQQALRGAREAATAEMVEQARKLGANAVVGVDLDYETVGKNGSMLLVAVTGTAIRVD